jgi:hypothetical protein
LAEDLCEEELKKRFVNVQLLIPKLGDADQPTQGMMDLLNDIKEARNTSVQVKQKSLADARRHFEVLKSALQTEPYFSDISWHEGQKGAIDGLQIITLLMIFYPQFCKEADNGEPSNAYGHKERCLDAYIRYAEKEPDELEAWIKVIPDVVRLFDELQDGFPKHYGGRFGKIKEVQIWDEKRYEKGNKRYRKTPAKSLFLGREMRYSYPIGWLYPLFAAFRVLAGPAKTGSRIAWKREPIEFWRNNADELCRRYEPHLAAVGYDTKRIATNPICYQAMRQAVTDLYKDEIIREAGLTI